MEFFEIPGKVKIGAGGIQFSRCAREKHLSSFIGNMKQVMSYGKLDTIQLFVQAHMLNSFPNKPWFLRICSTSLLKRLWEKEKLLVMSSVFYPVGELSAIFVKHKVVVCKLFQFG